VVEAEKAAADFVRDGACVVREICVTRLIQMCDMTHSNVCHDLIRDSACVRSCALHDSFIRDMTHPNVCRDLVRDGAYVNANI